MKLTPEACPDTLARADYFCSRSRGQGTLLAPGQGASGRLA